MDNITVVTKRILIVTVVGLYAALSFHKVNAENLYVDRIGLAEGLSQNSVIAIEQDHNGYIWFGTQSGLNRYDGYQFRVFLSDPDDPYSLSNIVVRSLLVDGRGTLWAGTLHGLNRYEAGTERFYGYYHDPANDNSLSHNEVLALQEDGQGNLWIGTALGLNRFFIQEKIFERYYHDASDEESLSNNVINTIFKDRKGNVWVGTDRGLNKFDQASNSFEKITDEQKVLQTDAVITLEEDEQGRLWIGTATKGVFVYDSNNASMIRYQHNVGDQDGISSSKISSLHNDSKGRMWVGTEDSGLDRYDKETGRFIHYRHNPNDIHSIAGNNVHSLLEDASGVFWIGSYTFGISKFNPYGFSMTLVSDKPSLEDPNPLTDIWPIREDRTGALWVGSSYNGVKVVEKDGTIRNFTHDPNNPRSLSSNRVYSLYEDKQGSFWVGTADGWINRYDRSTRDFTRYGFNSDEEGGVRHGKVRDMVEDSKGQFWVGMDGGATHIFDPVTGSIKHYHHDQDDPSTISSDRVFVIYEDRLKNLWFGTYGGGLNRFDHKTQTFTAFRHVEGDRDSIRGDFVTNIIEDYSDNALWIGMSGVGIDRFGINSGKFEAKIGKDHLPDTTIYGVLQDKQNRLWVTHNEGLTRIDLDGMQLSNYDEHEGLQSNEFNGGSAYIAPDGKFYFGGIHGYNAFYPEEIIDNPYKPPVYITELQLFNKPVGINEKYNGRVLLPKSILFLDNLVLSHKDIVFSFEFSALDYAFSDKNQYAYKMEGLEDEWNYVDSKRRFASYTTLPPGDYTFRVKASNSSGVWNEEGASINITITPPFWQTWWFRTLFVFFVILVVFAIYAIRVKAIKERNKLLKEQIKEATAELQKEKSNLEATLKELGETKDALIEAAHKAGMADTATGVLHNVGNILNSVNTSAGVIREMIDGSVTRKFLKAHELLSDHKGDLEEFVTKDSRGNKLLYYLLDLGGPFEKENSNLHENIVRLIEKVKAINEAISAQQDYAKGGAFVEKLFLSELVEEAIALQSGSINRHEIRIERQYDDKMPSVTVQKTKLLQIIINLYKNSKESMDACSVRESVLSIEIKRDEYNAYIAFVDNGIGIDKAKLESIFAHGFTTKENGHGFGLHSCANYMTEMGGRMWAESDGLDKGAKFVLCFPLDAAASSGLTGQHRIRKSKR